ncbi:MAG: amidohydrolase family protein [Pseudonocardiaceae bacterium]|nr:amidohydrolase family protein [Pseudonocardiaceae bacterium]
MTVFDAHLHIIDPRFPLVENQGYRPEPFTVDDYRARTEGLHIARGAVVSGSFQGTDQSYLIDALARLGSGFVGVTQLSPEVSDERIAELDTAGVRAVRFNLYRGGRQDLDELIELGHRVSTVAGWHVECYLDARDLPELADRLSRLPRISIDHLGLFTEGLPALLKLVGNGARVKATGFGRGDLDVPTTLRAISEANPDALLFGTDLPSTRAPRPFADTDIELIRETLDEGLARKALQDNAIAFYRLR